MKKHLYEISCNGCAVYDLPYMPRVLAEKQAKQMNKAVIRQYGNQVVKYTAASTGIRTKDATPRGYADYDDYCARVLMKWN